MSVDLFFRLFSSFANAAIFALVVKSKIRGHPELLIASGGKNIETVLLLLAALAYFLVFYLAVTDRRKKAKVYVSKIPKSQRKQFDIEDILLSISQSETHEDIKYEIKTRLQSCIQLFGKEEALKHLAAQHRLCVENERFYEQIAWQIGAIFVPVSLTLSALSQTQQVLHRNVAVAGGCILLWTWVFLFGRFRTNIRLYRDCAQLIEEMLGFFALTYVYDYCFEQYGRVIRVWPFLVTLCGLYFNYVVFILF